MLLVATLPTAMDDIDPKSLRATVEKLASFHTRNTSSPGLTEAAEWLASEYRKVPGIQAEIMKYTIPKGRRVPEEKEVVQVIAKLPGEDDRVLMVGGHFDSLNIQGDIMTGRAPGANDDGSGTALALEAARAMAGTKRKHTVMFVAWSGEEQGLFGSKAMAERAKTEGWKLDAVLSNDTVGSSSNKAGDKDASHIRLFSDESDEHQSRELARYIAWLARNDSFQPKLVFRRDRFGRGGDHMSFNEQGFTAVRFVEVHEEYTRQHTEDDLPTAMDFVYLANVTRLNVKVLSSLADAGPQPERVTVDRRQGVGAHIRWQATPGTEYEVFWRDTTSPVWEGSLKVGAVSEARFDKIGKDDHIFAVGAVGGIPVEAK